MTTYYVYPKFIELTLAGLTIKAMLLKDTASFNATHDYVSDLKSPVNLEVDAKGYARQTIPGTLKSDADSAYFTPSSSYIEFPAATYTFQYLVIFSDTGNDATSKVIGMIDFAKPTSVSARKLRITFTSNLIEGAV